MSIIVRGSESEPRPCEVGKIIIVGAVVLSISHSICTPGDGSKVGVVLEAFKSLGDPLVLRRQSDGCNWPSRLLFRCCCCVYNCSV